MNVVILPEVADYLEDLTYKLYLKEYFGFIDSARKYVDDLVDDIQYNIQNKVKKTSPARFRRYGSHYVTYRPNKRTTWYIFFHVKGDRYLIGYITNNHVSAQHIRGLR